MDKKDEYLFQCMKVWLYDRLNGGQMDVNIPMERFIAEFQLRFMGACNQYVDVDMLHVNRTLNEVSKEKPSHHVHCKTSSPILEQLMQRVTPETLAKAKRVMIQEVIDNKTAEYEARFKRFEGPEETETLKPRVYGYNDGLTDMFAFLEDLTEQPQDNGQDK